ncbi:MAG: hypothetical protein ABI910_16650 [Gemmatimonadota bacterium]
MVRERDGRRILSAVAIFLAAVALLQACTVDWGRASASSGPRYEFSAVGLSRFDGTPDRPRTDCRWWPTYGDAALCGPSANDPPAYRSLLRAYPLLQVALWLSVISLLLQALRVPRGRVLQAFGPAAVAGLTTGAVVSIVRGVRHGLATLSGVEVVFDGSGYRFAVAAALLSAVSALLLLTTVAKAGVAHAGDVKAGDAGESSASVPLP